MTEADLAPLIAAHGPWVLFLMTVVEGPLATIAAGALAARGHLDLTLVLLLATLGDLCGDLLLYLAGRFAPRLWPGARDRAARHLARLGPAPGRHAWTMIVLGKWTHVLGFAILLGAGMARLPLLPFLAVSALATLPKVALLAALGHAATQGLGIPSLALLAAALGSATLILLALLARAALPPHRLAGCLR
ncbi:VTT domain-containing protein [Tabrizicola sp. TH137]|uniref:VTT domain-containing protein n=1 Tax=Tabrizicola sp. TH137 TaxID=2067452 RepID=UPI001304217F|nr:VTT domain-containing protein [Tabrizicola sp. TH137]